VYISGRNGVEVLPFEFETARALTDIPFRSAANPVLICGADREGIDCIQRTPLEGVKLAFVLNGPNAFGTALLAGEQRAVSFSEALADGRVKGIITLEADLPSELPPEIRVLAVADWLPTRLIAQGEIFLPVTSWIEMDGTYINHEGRAQHFTKVMRPGLPIKGLSPELHPPRIHRHDAPGGDILSTEEIVLQLLERLGSERTELTGCGEAWKFLTLLEAESNGFLIYERNNDT
jgi:NADH-quinone oxidoreductase subunit G